MKHQLQQICVTRRETFMQKIVTDYINKVKEAERLRDKLEEFSESYNNINNVHQRLDLLINEKQALEFTIASQKEKYTT